MSFCFIITLIIVYCNVLFKKKTYFCITALKEASIHSWMSGKLTKHYSSAQGRHPAVSQTRASRLWVDAHFLLSSETVQLSRKAQGYISC